MKNYVQRDENITVTAAETATSGGGVLLDAFFGVASGDAAIGKPLVLVTVGVFDMPKVATDEISIGKPLFWDDTAKLVTVDGAGNTRIGVAVSAAGNPSGSVRVRLNGSF